MSPVELLDKMQAEAEKLAALLKDRELGLMSWHDALERCTDNLRSLLNGEEPHDPEKGSWL